MTIHYHGTPITPKEVLQSLAGHCFCVSFYRPDNIVRCHAIGQSVMLDNGAYSIWRGSGEAKLDWRDYYTWSEKWLEYQTTWAVIPDVIGGDEAVNDRLCRDWPHRGRGAPVWHMHESMERLRALAKGHNRICFGSSAEYSVVCSPKWMRRMSEAFDEIAPSGRVDNWVHMLRGMQCCMTHFPFASVDSTDVARNYTTPQLAHTRAERWDLYQCPPTWIKQATQASIEYEPIIFSEWDGE